MAREVFDLLVVGGGINGVSIARDAAGRGLSVLLVEQGDLGGATSSASSKLIHGGLRYLEQYAFRLVRESLLEREVLLGNAPHIIRPLRFVLPHADSLRPAWLIRAGLWLYDRLSGASALPGSMAVDLGSSPYGAGLASGFRKGFVYSDCWVDDARFVALTAVDAAARGAVIRTRTRCGAARRVGGLWEARLETAAGSETVSARGMVNAAGPWALEVLTGVASCNAPARLRLVKGSHIVVPRLHLHDHALILQNADRRIVFVIPYEGAFSLIGTTDVALDGEPPSAAVRIDAAETRYLCDAVNRYFAAPVAPEDVVWSFAGVRPLYDDGAHDPSSVTRDYVLKLDASAGAAPILSVFGGKVTTTRRLAEHALQELAPHFAPMGPRWTAEAPLPGGDMAAFDAFLGELAGAYPALDRAWLQALARRHGTRVRAILDGIRTAADLGADFGAGLHAREVDWLMAEEWAVEAEDVLWRRTKCGLHMEADQRRAVADYMLRKRSG